MKHFVDVDTPTKEAHKAYIKYALQEARTLIDGYRKHTLCSALDYVVVSKMHSQESPLEFELVIETYIDSIAKALGSSCMYVTRTEECAEWLNDNYGSRECRSLEKVRLYRLAWIDHLLKQLGA